VACYARERNRNVDPLKIIERVFRSFDGPFWSVVNFLLFIVSPGAESVGYRKDKIQTDSHASVARNSNPADRTLKGLRRLNATLNARKRSTQLRFVCK
jgi:hypothetical protein